MKINAAKIKQFNQPWQIGIKILTNSQTIEMQIKIKSACMKINAAYEKQS